MTPTYISTHTHTHTEHADGTEGMTVRELNAYTLGRFLGLAALCRDGRCGPDTAVGLMLTILSDYEGSMDSVEDHQRKHP